MEPKKSKANRGNGAPALDLQKWVNEEDGRVSRRIFSDPVTSMHLKWSGSLTAAGSFWHTRPKSPGRVIT